MVAISMYRGDLHAVPKVPRQWLLPIPTINLKDFRILLIRRARALYRINHPNRIGGGGSEGPVARPDPAGVSEGGGKELRVVERSEGPVARPDPAGVPEGGEKELRVVERLQRMEEEDVEGLGKLCDEIVAVEGSGAPVVVAAEANGGGSETAKIVEEANGSGLETEIAKEDLGNADVEARKDNVSIDENDKRRKEVEEKLQILKAKKHNLVQALKQILNAEEELRNRNMQDMAARPPVRLQVDVTNVSGSMSRRLTPRMGSDLNSISETEGAETDDVPNHNMHSRSMLRTSSVSPSSDNLHKRPFYNGVPNPSRGSLAVAGSPSRFAPTVQQGNPSSQPTVSASGTSYIASSPSPAGSGGTSVFRDARLPSPWN